MNKLQLGRVVDTWSEDGQRWVEFLVGEKRKVFTIDTIEEFRGTLPQKGDLGQFVGDPLRFECWGKPSTAWNAAGDSLRWRRTTGQATRMQRLRQRHQIIKSIRDDLDAQDFIEVETPLCVKGACPDSYIQSIETDSGAYLVTSTEYQIKRLIVGGFEKVFTLTQNFRANDRGRFHSSEFTMLEWARAGEGSGPATLDAIEEDVIRMIRKAFRLLYPNSEFLTYKNLKINLMGLWERITVRDAFHKYLGLDDVGDFSFSALTRAAQSAGIPAPTFSSEDRDSLLSYLLDLLQVHLGHERPTFLREWPAFMTCSAELSPHDPTLATRSELYIAGIEIADGFPFLRDANKQREYFSRELQSRIHEGKKSVVLDEKYVEALAEGIPPGAGMALGVDRLVMALTNAECLTDVQAFSWEEL